VSFSFAWFCQARLLARCRRPACVASSLINIVALLAVFLSLFALVSVLERKILARIQNRLGPNRVGPFGLLQPVADGIKMLIKEDIVPLRADKVVHFLAPILIAATAILALGIIPYGRNMTPFSIDGGLLFFFAIGSTTELSVFMAGWGSNKFSARRQRAIVEVSANCCLLTVARSWWVRFFRMRSSPRRAATC
jgi:NADH:ubiquinone oxidoreductase subunit H